MRSPQFGVLYSRLHPVISPGDFALQTESAGYGSVWVPEGIAKTGSTLEPVVAMTAMTSSATRITVGSCVIKLPLRTPAIFAKEIASLDLLANGRIVLGVGVGARCSADFCACGKDPRNRGALCDEILECLIALWRGESTTHHGRFFDFEDIVVKPVPFQDPHPPLWMGGEEVGVLERTARLGNSFAPMAAGPDNYRRLSKQVSRFAETVGRDPAVIARAVHLYACLDDDGAGALATVEHTLTERYGYEVTRSENTVIGPLSFFNDLWSSENAGTSLYRNGLPKNCVFQQPVGHGNHQRRV